MLIYAKSFQIDLNVAGVYKRLAQHGLDEIIREHEYLHGHLDVDAAPPLAAEQATLDAVVSYTYDARVFYDLAKVCQGTNADVVIVKANELEQVSSKTEEVRVEMRKLGKRRTQKEEEDEELRKDKEREKHLSKLEEAFCPAEIMDMPGAGQLHNSNARGIHAEKAGEEGATGVFV